MVSYPTSNFPHFCIIFMDLIYFFKICSSTNIVFNTTIYKKSHVIESHLRISLPLYLHLVVENVDSTTASKFLQMLQSLLHFINESWFWKIVVLMKIAISAYLLYTRVKCCFKILFSNGLLSIVVRTKLSEMEKVLLFVLGSPCTCYESW